MVSKKSKQNAKVLHSLRALVAILALLVAAAHLGYIGSPAPRTAPTSGNTLPAAPSYSGFNAIGFWFEVEVIAYTLIAMVYLLGLRSWYLPSVIFNAFNLCIFFISGLVAIPGITSMAFGGRFFVFSSFSSLAIIAFGWILVFILSLVLFKYDPGSELDKLLVTRRS